MKTILPILFQPNRFKRAKRLAGLGIISLAIGGCASLSPQDLTLGAGYEPKNTYSWSTLMPGSVRRVALMPLVCDERSSDLVAGRDTLEPIMRSELAKTKRFELVCAAPEVLRSRTGHRAWAAEDALPPNFFTSLTNAYGCDAVLFCRLTVFRAYAPMAIGWRMQLVDTHSQRTLWSADEIFDAGQPAVADGARRYQLAELRDSRGTPDPWVMFNSPSQFGQYATSKLLATLPNR
jgi:hypothetical protein